MLAAVVLVGVGDRLRLPWPALMVVLGLAVAFAPGLPDTFALDPDLILPLFLPPLLFATAQRTSWALFRSRWRSIAFLAVALVADRLDALRQARDVTQRVQSEALAAARAEVLAARREPGIDPEAADRVLRRLDLRTVLLD